MKNKSLSLFLCLIRCTAVSLASLVAPAFSPVLFDIAEQEHSEYVFPGGRGSTKSSFCGLNVIDLLMKNENMHACILRSVANTLKDSVYSQYTLGNICTWS